MGVPTSIFTTIAQHSEKGQNTKNPTTWVIGQPTEWIGSGLAIMSQNVPAAAETSYLVLFLPGCASFVSYCIVLCCASFDFYGYIKDTHGSREEGRQKMAPSDQRSNICVASNPKKSQFKSGGIFDKSKPSEGPHPDNLGGENHLHCQVSAFPL